MKILIVTQKVDQNDDVLGFFHRWIDEFAKYCEQVTVIALGVGEYNLPTNVRVFSLGKELGVSKIKYLINFYSIIVKERNHYEAIFVHMNHIYIVIGGLLWRLWGKRISFWYSHKSVTFSLRIATLLTHHVFSPARIGFRINTRKLIVTGQGIDTTFLDPVSRSHVNKDHTVLNVVTIGRISPIKDYETIIRAVNFAKEKGIMIKFSIVGGASSKDVLYEAQMKKLVSKLKLSPNVIFVGPVANKLIYRYLTEADLFLSAGKTGGVDKAVLEAWAYGVPTISCNESFKEDLSPMDLYFMEGDSTALGEAIVRMGQNQELRVKYAKILKEKVVKEHNLTDLVHRLTHVMMSPVSYFK